MKTFGINGVITVYSLIYMCFYTFPFLYIPQKNSTIICAVNIRRNMLSGYTVE